MNLNKSKMEYSYELVEPPKKRILRPSSSVNSINPNPSRISNLSQLNTVIKHEHKTSKPPIVFKQKQITEQLQKQITQIEQCLTLYSPFVKHINEKQKSKPIKEQIFSLEDFIKSKDNEIKSISEQIQYLKLASNKAQNNNLLSRDQQNHLQYRKLSQSDQIQNPVFKLAEELKTQRQFLEKLQYQHQNKRSKLIEITSMVNQIEAKFIEKCKKTKQKPITYAEFKNLNEEKKKAVEKRPPTKREKSTHRLRQSSIKQPANFIFNMQTIKNEPPQTAYSKKTLKDFQNRKAIAAQALKNAKKKHNLEIRQLVAKIQFLRDEDSLLYEKIKEKEYERVMLENKFEEKGSSYHLSSHRLFSPNREYHMKSGSKTKSSRFMSPSFDSIKEKSHERLKTYHFSPHRKLTSARKNAQQFQVDNINNEQYDAEYRPRDKRQKGSFFETQQKRYDTLEQRQLNPASKNSFIQPSTNLHDSILQN